MVEGMLRKSGKNVIRELLVNASLFQLTSESLGSKNVQGCQS
jgi:hypothetical protein